MENKSRQMGNSSEMISM